MKRQHPEKREHVHAYPSEILGVSGERLHRLFTRVERKSWISNMTALFGAQSPSPIVKAAKPVFLLDDVGIIGDR